MIREFSAGGVVVRRMRHRWWIAAIEPQGRRSPAGKPSTRESVLALPKGAVDQGETAEQTALREVHDTAVNAPLSLPAGATRIDRAQRLRITLNARE